MDCPSWKKSCDFVKNTDNDEDEPQEGEKREGFHDERGKAASFGFIFRGRGFPAVEVVDVGEQGDKEACVEAVFVHDGSEYVHIWLRGKK